jgi:tetratricopeptide (TPR) repeat protein/serine/threonine protein kinase
MNENASNQKKKIEAIYYTALEKKSPEEQRAYLEEVCGENKELLGKVEALLKAHEKAEGFLEVPILETGVTLDESPLTEGPGTKIGRYKLLELIGEGGFGVVYMAEQEEPIRRRVALKIIKLGMDTKRVIARFEAERRALALMDHSNIARVFDAGATETGRPYFVMELVKGIPITEYCDKNNLNTRQRLELFIDVCKAVQHAHQKGIIHRDIKPSNVMITLHDGKPVPKVIDFGIAKATQHRLTEKTLFTEYREFVGTPEYMSPEQAEMSGLDIDTRSDIYSLGVLLYELLTGTTPFEAEKLRSAAYDEIRRIISEDEPPKPSTRLSTLGEMLADVAKHRHVQPEQLCKIVRGDLDWVVMKALEKNRTRRYETANGLARDIERHLCDEPVTASPPSTVYKLHKFIRRHRAGVVFGLLFTAALVIGFSLATVGFVQASRERDRAVAAEKEAKAIADFLENDVLASVEPAKAKGTEVSVRYILDAASESMVDKFADKPLVEASICQTLGSTYMSLGKFEVAELHLERARQIYRKQFGDEHPDTATSMFKLGTLYIEQSRHDEAESLYSKALEVRKRVLGEDHPDTLISIYYLAWLYWDQGRMEEAEPMLVKALDGQRRVMGEDHPDTLNSMFGLAYVYHQEDHYDEAGLLYVKALENQRRVLGEEHPDTLRTMGSLGHLYDVVDRYEEAELLLVNMLEGLRRVMGDEHPRTLESLGDLAQLYVGHERYDEAEILLTEALEVDRQVLGEEHKRTLETMRILADVYVYQGRYKEAEQLQIKTLEIASRVLGEEDPDTLTAMNNLASTHLRLGQWDKAIADYSKIIELDPNNSHAWTARGSVYFQLGQWNKMATDYSKAIELDPNEWWYWHERGCAYMELGQWDKVVTDYSKAIELEPEIADCYNQRAIAYQQLGQWDKMAADCSKAIELDPNNPDQWRNRGKLYFDIEQWDKAIADYSKAIDLDPNNSNQWRNRGNMYYDMEQWDKAIADYSKAIDLDPNNVHAWRARGSSYLKIKRPVGQSSHRLFKGH